MKHYYADIEHGTVGVVRRSDPENEATEEVVATFPEEAIPDILPYLAHEQVIAQIKIKASGRTFKDQKLYGSEGKVELTVGGPGGFRLDFVVDPIQPPEP